MKTFYVTTAIDYANGSPHIGHAYEKILADALVRSRRMEGISCHFLTGLDEHGQKVQETAQGKNMEPQQLCDAVAKDFQKLCARLSISHDDYIRTTEERHRSSVGRILAQLQERGEIYKAEYRGLYSTRAERFVQEKDRVDGQWPEEFGEVRELREPNYFFRLGRHREWLIHNLETHDDFIIPQFRQRQALEFLREPINDLCISRPRSRLSWGIGLPFDGDYVTYVWFDALINYISAIGYGGPDFERHWPADFHVIGKDILVPAHAVYWPIILHAMGIPLPRHLLVHGWWLTTAGEKMSKSLGNTIQPIDYIDRYGADAFRYFVLREMALGQDCNFSQGLFLARYEGELANDLGNLLSRLHRMLQRYCAGIIPGFGPPGEAEEELRRRADATIRAVRRAYGDLEFSRALEQVFALIRETNRYAEVRSPWKLAKREDGDSRQLLGTSLATLAEALRIAAVLLFPAMPTAVGKILGQLGGVALGTWKELAWGDSLPGKAVGEGEILFPRKEEHALPPLP